VLPGAPHMLFIEQLEATAAVMMRFLGSLPSHRTA
jgi:hypothetical protein